MRSLGVSGIVVVTVLLLKVFAPFTKDLPSKQEREGEKSLKKLQGGIVTPKLGVTIPVGIVKDSFSGLIASNPLKLSTIEI